MPATAPSLPPLLGPGDAIPWFRAKALSGADDYVFDTAAGRHMLLLLLGSAGRAEAKPALRLLAARRALLDDERACFFGVSIDPEDSARGRIRQRLPGIRWFLDHDRAVSRLLRAEANGSYRPHWLLVDPMLRVVERFPLAAGETAFVALEAAAARPAGPDWAPVLMAPNIFEPELCRRLISVYEEDGGEPSGFMREAGGRTILAADAHHKLRRDCVIDSPELRRELQARILARLVPMVARVFQFQATRMERYLIGCYTAGAGHFRPHRDNTTRGTAHRRFAVTVNLNSGDYEGGDLRFPEYGPRTYRPPTGGAIVFSCSLLHEATPVTRGTRYAFLPFLYDEPAAQQREENNPYLAGEVEPYKKG